MTVMNAINAAGQVDITILVKALNEEDKIEACLRSALNALARLHDVTGEVLLADSVSTDRTVEIAARLGVRVVQFENVRDRGCGAALQLGYQYALGRYLYVLDGDMQMAPDFLALAYAYLQSHPDVGGIGGRLIDTHLRTEADLKRAAYYDSLQTEQAVSALGGGGLYRRDAIDRVGYLSNRWLPAFEEAELGVRLNAAGYRLVRLPAPAIYHEGHAETSTQMLRRLWRNRRIDASGMFLRSALGRPWLGAAMKECWYVFVAPGLWFASVLLAIAAASAGLPMAAVTAIPLAAWAAVFLLLGMRKRSARKAAHGILSWHLFALGALRGFVKPTRDPMARIPARELH